MYVCYNRDQMVSSECDVVTGFHVEDWEQHIIVLEGLRAGGIHSLWQQLPHHSTQGEGMDIIHILLNSSLISPPPPLLMTILTGQVPFLCWPCS